MIGQDQPQIAIPLTGADIKALYEVELKAFTDALFDKLGTIESNAKDDQTAAEIKTLYEGEVKAFTDALFDKLGTIEANAKDDQTGAEIKSAYEVEANAFTDALFTKLGTIETNAKDDQTGAEIKTLYEAQVNAFTDGLFTKLAGIEALAEVNQSDAEIKSQYEANTNTNGFTDAEKSKLAGLESSLFLGEYATLGALQTAHPAPVTGSFANVDAGVGNDVERYLWDTDDAQYVLQLGVSTLLSDAQIKTQYEANPDTNAFQDAEKSKLAGIEILATADQTGAEIKAAYESELNAFTDTLFAKLFGIEENAEVNLDVDEVTLTELAGSRLHNGPPAGLTSTQSEIAWGSNTVEIDDPGNFPSHNETYSDDAEGSRVDAGLDGGLYWVEAYMKNGIGLMPAGKYYITTNYQLPDLPYIYLQSGNDPQGVYEGSIVTAVGTEYVYSFETFIPEDITSCWSYNTDATPYYVRFWSGDPAIAGAGVHAIHADYKNKIDSIEDNATADQTGAEIKVAYEAEADTNAFDDAAKTKLDGLVEGGENIPSDEVTLHDEVTAGSSPAVAGLTATQMSSVWEAGFASGHYLSSGSYADDAVGSRMDSLSTPAEEVVGGFNPFATADASYYFTSDSNNIDLFAVLNGTGPGFNAVLEGSIVTAVGTEYVYRVDTVSVGSTPDTFSFENPVEAFYIRFWDGDPAIIGSSVQKLHDDYKNKIDGIAEGADVSLASDEITLTDEAGSPVANPSAGSLTNTIASSVWGAGYLVNGGLTEGSYVTDALGTVLLSADIGDPFYASFDTTLNPRVTETLYFTSDSAVLADNPDTGLYGGPLQPVLEGSIVTAVGTEYIYRLDVVSGSNIEGLGFGDDYSFAFYVRFWDGDPAVLSASLQKLHDDYKNKIDGIEVGADVSLDPDEVTLTEQAGGSNPSAAGLTDTQIESVYGDPTFFISNLFQGAYADDAVGSKIDATGGGIMGVHTQHGGGTIPVGDYYITSDVTNLTESYLSTGGVAFKIHFIEEGSIVTAYGTEYIYKATVAAPTTLEDILNSKGFDAMFIRRWDGDPAIVGSSVLAFHDDYKNKIDGIEDNADVTDSANVGGAGAVMDSDIAEAQGFMLKVSAGIYKAIKANIGSAIDPVVTDDSASGYVVHSVWHNTTLKKVFICVDASVGAAVWREYAIDTQDLSDPGADRILFWDDSTGLLAYLSLSSQLQFNGTTLELVNIEAGATADQTGAEIKALYELETNAFTDALFSKLAGIESNATADQTGAEIKVAYEGEADTNVFDDADVSKLAGIEALAKDDQTGAEIKAAYEGESNTNGFTDAEKSKLAGLESSLFLGEYATLGALQTAHPAPVTGSFANVDAGIGSDVERYVWDTDDAQYVLQLGVSTVLTDAQIKSQYEANADTNAFLDAEKSKLSGVELNAKDDQTGAEIKALYELETNAYDDTKNTKLNGIETNATADQTGAEIKAAYEGEANTNEFNDAEKTKLSTVETNAKDDQSGAEIKSAYEAEANAYTDTKDTKLAGIETAAEVNTIDSDPSGVTGADQVINVMSLTQAEFDAIGTPNAFTLYVITS